MTSNGLPPLIGQSSKSLSASVNVIRQHPSLPTFVSTQRTDQALKAARIKAAAKARHRQMMIANVITIAGLIAGACVIGAAVHYDKRLSCDHHLR